MATLEGYSPSKRKACPPRDDTVSTPKKRRTAPPTPPPTVTRRTADGGTTTSTLPPQLSRIAALHTSLEQKLSHALAANRMGVSLSPSSKASESEDSDKRPQIGRVLNVVNHYNLQSVGLSHEFSTKDLSRLVWLWEWDGEALPIESTEPSGKSAAIEEDSPFHTVSKDWTRGGMGIVISATTHSLNTSTGTKRLAAYGIGIQVDIINGCDMGAVARWMTASEKRRGEVMKKLKKWAQLHKPGAQSRRNVRASSPTPSIPPIPVAILPSLTPPKPVILPDSIFSTPRKPKAPRTANNPLTASEKKLAAPFPFPVTPSSLHSSTSSAAGTPRPQTPETPRNNKIPETPSRAALRERIRLKSLNTPSKPKLDRPFGDVTEKPGVPGGAKSSGLDQLRRRCQLGRLPDIVEAVWMLFSAQQSTSSGSTPSTRKRRAMPFDDVVSKIAKSSKTPVSNAEVSESITLLTELCPRFLRQIVLEKEQWLEMPSTTSVCPPSPSRFVIEKELTERKTGEGSPKRISRRSDGAIELKDVREVIRKELEKTSG